MSELSIDELRRRISVLEERARTEDEAARAKRNWLPVSDAMLTSARGAKPSGSSLVNQAWESALLQANRAHP